MTHTIPATATTPTTRRSVRKPARLVGVSPANDVESYDSIPWYRKQWFALFPLLAPVLIVIALTGDVYTKSTGSMRAYSDAEVWRFSVASRAFFVAAALFTTVFVTLTIWV